MIPALLARLRKAFTPSSDPRPDDLAEALGHVRALDALVRQCASIDRLERLAARSASVVAGAVDASRAAVLVADGRGGLRQVREDGWRAGRFDEAEGSHDALRGVLAVGIPRVFDGAPDGLFVGTKVRQVLVVPLRADEEPVGLLCLADGRPEGFLAKDVRACERFAGPLAHLLSAALKYRKAHDERRAAEGMARLLTGRERRMRELKARAAGERV